MTIEGDEQLDLLRDVIAELGLPLHRLSTRLTSLDEVFLDRAAGPVSERVFERANHRYGGDVLIGALDDGGPFPHDSIGHQ